MRKINHLIPVSKANKLQLEFNQSSSSSSSGTNISYFSRELANNSPSLNPTNANTDTTAATLTNPNWCGRGGLDNSDPVLLVTTVLEGKLFPLNLKDAFRHELRELLKSSLPAIVSSKTTTVGEEAIVYHVIYAWLTFSAQQKLTHVRGGSDGLRFCTSLYERGRLF